jgi:hypothetical protein
VTVTCSVYGVGLRINVPLSGLSSLDPADRIDVSMEVGELPAAFRAGSPAQPFYETDAVDDDGAPLARVSRIAGGGYFAIDYLDGTRVVVDAAGERIWADTPSGDLDNAATYLLGPVLGFVLRLRGVTCLHASAVAIGGRAFLFVGPSGCGKSSIAAALALRGHAVLSDDVTPLAESSGEFLAQPAYPRLRLWPESVKSLFGSVDAMPLIAPGWDKRHVDLGEEPLRFQRNALPLGAIYLLRSESADPHLERVNPREALMALIADAYTTRLIDRGLRAREFDVLGRIVAGVALRRLQRGTDLSRLGHVCDLVVRDAEALASH